MSERTKQQASSKLDLALWVLIAGLFVGGMVANNYFQAIPLPLRVIGWILLFALLLGTACLSSQGKRVLGFSREARIELRKVVWPTRQETVHTTLIVAALIVIMGLLLWSMDSILLWLIGLLTGQRG